MYQIRKREVPAIYKLSEPLLTKSLSLQGDQAAANPVLSPIDLVAMILRIELLDLVTEIDIEDDAIREERSLIETTISAKLVVGHWKSGHWESYWSNRVMIEANVRNLSAALASEEWSKGHAPLAKKLLQEYVMILHRTQSQGEYIREGVQQINALTSIEETRRGMQHSDSLRR